MTIPDNITREHIEKAIKKINKSGIPDGENLKHYNMVFKGRECSAKHVILKVIDPQKSDTGILPFARIIIRGKRNSPDWDGGMDKAKQSLELVHDKWPEKYKAIFLITCGGFLKFDWPKNIKDDEIKNNLSPSTKILKKLTSAAEKQCKRLISEKMRKSLSKFASFITIGMDSYKDEDCSRKKPHIELVCFINLKEGSYHFTGKSLPTPEQKNHLVRYADYSSHFPKKLPSIGNIMILGCHDLNVFSSRSKANAKAQWRKKMRREFISLCKRKKPKYVLQHPHNTDSTKNWCQGWGGLIKQCPSTDYASAGTYCWVWVKSEKKWIKKAPRSSLAEVLEKTKKGSSLDFIIEAVS